MAHVKKEKQNGSCQSLNSSCDYLSCDASFVLVSPVEHCLFAHQTAFYRDTHDNSCEAVPAEVQQDRHVICLYNQQSHIQLEVRTARQQGKRVLKSAFSKYVLCNDVMLNSDLEADGPVCMEPLFMSAEACAEMQANTRQNTMLTLILQ